MGGEGRVQGSPGRVGSPVAASPHMHQGQLRNSLAACAGCEPQNQANMYVIAKDRVTYENIWWVGGRPGNRPAGEDGSGALKQQNTRLSGWWLPWHRVREEEDRVAQWVLPWVAAASRGCTGLLLGAFWEV